MNFYRSLDPGKVWAAYAEAIGLDVMKTTYGEHWPPQAERPLEEVYIVVGTPGPVESIADLLEPVAWVSLTKNQFDPTTAHMSRGVWPGQHGHGIGKLMRAWAEAWCREQGVDELNISVSANNPLHLANVMKDPYWTLSGVSWSIAGPEFTFAHDIE